jgi:threonine dehydratase
MRAFGATVVLHGKDFDEAKDEARLVSVRLGVRMVEDSLDVETGEGAGTIGLELARFPERLDAVIVALGNGALACGVGRYLKEVSPGTRIVAVQAAGAPAMIESWKQRKRVVHDTLSTIADGIGVREPIPECIQDMDGTIDEGLLVQEASLIEAMRLAHQHLGLVFEPSGVAGLAALMENREKFRGQTVGLIFCGGNLTQEQMRTWLG